VNLTIADYGSSNLNSVCRAFAACGAEVKLAATPHDVSTADRLVLPGVGAFGDCAERLRTTGLDEAILRHIGTGRPFLGICVGMQLLMEYSEEYGVHQGLKVFGGAVRAIPGEDERGKRKIPHVGWRILQTPDRERWAKTILDGIGPEDSVYFVHSFTAWPENEDERLADADHDGSRVTAAVHRDLIYGCQFHPEKSGVVGLRILSNFLTCG
jgi:imidazole glycerol-phosphate synthase subunit HisH